MGPSCVDNHPFCACNWKVKIRYLRCVQRLCSCPQGGGNLILLYELVRAKRLERKRRPDSLAFRWELSLIDEINEAEGDVGVVGTAILVSQA